MSAIYSKAIEFIAADDQDWKAIAVEVAKINPELFVSAVERVKHGDWEIKATGLMRAGDKVEAIKYCRSATGWDLKTAKTAVESLRI